MRGQASVRWLPPSTSASCSPSRASGSSCASARRPAYAEMRDSPVVLVGAINTDWATQLTAESDFVFDETRSRAQHSRERRAQDGSGRWREATATITKDYGLITRQLSGGAGQFLVQVAGISHFGTEAASEFLANKKEFADALRSQSINHEEEELSGHRLDGRHRRTSRAAPCRGCEQLVNLSRLRQSRLEVPNLSPPSSSISGVSVVGLHRRRAEAAHRTGAWPWKSPVRRFRAR